MGVCVGNKEILGSVTGNFLISWKNENAQGRSWSYRHKLQISWVHTVEIKENV